MSAELAKGSVNKLALWRSEFWQENGRVLAGFSLYTPGFSAGASTQRHEGAEGEAGLPVCPSPVPSPTGRGLASDAAAGLTGARPSESEAAPDGGAALPSAGLRGTEALPPSFWWMN